MTAETNHQILDLNHFVIHAVCFNGAARALQKITVAFCEDESRFTIPLSHLTGNNSGDTLMYLREVDNQNFVILHFCINDFERLFHTLFCEFLTFYVQVSHLSGFFERFLIISLNQQLKCLVCSIKSALGVNARANLKTVIVRGQCLILQSKNFKQCLQADIARILHLFKPFFNDCTIIML